MSFPVVWLMPDVPRAHDDSRHRLTWAQADVEQILTDAGGQHLVGFDELDDDAVGACVVVPAEYYVDQAPWLNAQINNLDWAVVFLTSDETSKFAAGRLAHRLGRMRVWTQTPRRVSGDDTSRFLPFGLPPDTTRLLAGTDPTSDRKYGWCFSGQVNHERRHQLVDAVRGLPDGYELVSGGFTQGLDRPEFLELLAETKVVPCPAGPATPDSFRLWEALEAGCVPVVDGRCPAYAHDYWRMLFDGAEPPFATVGDWGQFPALLGSVLASWPANANGVGSWWQQYRRQTARRIRADIAEMSGVTQTDDAVTVLIPTSPIPAHPDTAMIEETVASVRFHLPDAEILVMADGVRPDQEHRRADYETYQQRLLWLARHRWAPATVFRFDDYQHQANMARLVLNQVDTPLVLYVEHDTPLVTDEPIDWAACKAPILADELDVLRFHYEAVIPEPHQHLMIDTEHASLSGCPLIRTYQFSARPHLASTKWYRQVVAEHFPETCRTFLEDKLHSVCQSERWGRNRLAIYAPNAANLKRSLNLDGRGDDPKFDCVFS